jgi:hypothetical protein
MVQKRFPTNYRLWLIISACIFIVLGFVDLLAGANWKADYSLWADFNRFVQGAYSCDTGDMLVILIFRGFLQAIPSIIIGWALQALIVVVWFSNRNEVSSRDGSRSIDGIVSP